MIDRERELIQQYNNAHRAYLNALDVVRAAVFGRALAVNGSAKSQVTKAKHRLEQAERELQQFWSAEQVAQEVSG
jgi:hypothetical protein